MFCGGSRESTPAFRNSRRPTRFQPRRRLVDWQVYRQDAQLILQLLLEKRFPKIWVPSGENRDLRQLLWHRHRMERARTRIMNQLQALALNQGLRCKKGLWREHGRQQLEAFRLAPWASRRRHDLLERMGRLNPTIAELTQAIEQEAQPSRRKQEGRPPRGVWRCPVCSRFTASSNSSWPAPLAPAHRELDQGDCGRQRTVG